MKTMYEYDLVRLFCREGLSRHEIARRTGLHRQTIAKMLLYSSPPGYRLKQSRPKIKLGPFFTSLISIPNSGNEIDQVKSRLAEIAKTINNLIDIMTSVNREFVDKRIIELKREKIELEGQLRALETEGNKRLEAGAIVEESMAMASDYRRVFAEGTVEEKRFFLRAFLTGIKLDPENAEGEARFVLLPGMQKLLQEPMSSRLYRALPHEKDPAEADRSSRSFIAL